MLSGCRVNNETKNWIKRKAHGACKVINQTKDEFAKTVYDSLKRNRESGYALIVATLISAFGFGVENNGRRPTQIEEMKKLAYSVGRKRRRKRRFRRSVLFEHCRFNVKRETREGDGNHSRVGKFGEVDGERDDRGEIVCRGVQIRTTETM